MLEAEVLGIQQIKGRVCGDPAKLAVTMLRVVTLRIIIDAAVLEADVIEGNIFQHSSLVAGDIAGAPPLATQMVKADIAYGFDWLILAAAHIRGNQQRALAVQIDIVEEYIFYVHAFGLWRVSGNNADAGARIPNYAVVDDAIANTAVANADAESIAARA